MFGEEDRSTRESDRLEGLFETVYCSGEAEVPKKLKIELEEQEMSSLGSVCENTANSFWKCLVPECEEVFNTREKIYTHVKKVHKHYGKNPLQFILE